jgi:Tfp pilus assembly protein PilF
MLFHALNSFLLFLFIRRMCGRGIPALAAALLFAAHPALTDDVCWICSRSDLLCMFFYLGALLSWLRAEDLKGEESANRRYAFTAISLLCLALALLSKEMGITFVGAIIAISFWREGFRALHPRKWPSYLPYVVLTCIYLPIRMNIMSNFAHRGQWGENLAASIVIGAKAVAFYLGILLHPFGLTIFPLIETDLQIFSPLSISAVALVVGLLVAALLLRRKYPTVSLGIALFFILLLPVSGIIPLTTIVAGRFVYVPSLGFFLATAALAGQLLPPANEASPTRRTIGAAVIAVVIFLFSLNTIIRSIDWRSDLALFESAAEVDPDSIRARVALGKELFFQKNVEASRVQALAAIAIDPRHAEARSLMGRIYEGEGLINEAAREFNLALEVSPYNNYVHNALGTIYKDQGRLEEALAHFEKASSRQPIIWGTLNNAGSVLMEMERTGEALEYFSRALKVKPDSPEAAYNKAATLAGLGRSTEAARFLENWMAENSPDGPMLALLGLIHTKAMRIDAAVNAYRRALHETPDDTRTASLLADLHMGRGEYDDATVLYETILKEHPDVPANRIRLAAALEKSGRIGEAIEQLRQAAILMPDDDGLKKKIIILLKKTE